LHETQLLRYFTVSKAKFGVLTNGIIYRFYTDLEEPNKMDEKPFLEINLTDLRPSQIEELKKFHKSYFDVENVMSTASELKYMRELKAEFAEEFDIPIVGLPGTIDNDLYGTDLTIGYDTTLNTIMDCVDKIRDTANSHERIFFIEVMGRDAGFLAQNSAIAAGAEAAIIPEDSTGSDQLIKFMERGIRKSKKSCMVIVSESPKCGALYYADRVNKEYPQFDVRVSILGHLQRGGRPSARDRVLASRVGVGAITALVQGQRNVMVGIRNHEIVYVPFIEAVQKRKGMNPQLIQVLNELSI